MGVEEEWGALPWRQSPGSPSEPGFGHLRAGKPRGSDPSPGASPWRMDVTSLGLNPPPQKSDSNSRLTGLRESMVKMPGTCLVSGA